MASFFRRYKSTIYGNYRKAYCVDGVLTGVCMSALMAIRDLIASKPMASPENYVTEIILAVGILWSTYQYRKQLSEGKVTFKELMLLGLGIGVVSALVYGHGSDGCTRTKCRSGHCHRESESLYCWRLGLYRRIPVGGDEYYYSVLCRTDIPNRERDCGDQGTENREFKTNSKITKQHNGYIDYCTAV